MDHLSPWIMLILLGAYHGLNPAMGWLFAVAVGLQERRRSAVLRSFGPIALGHAVSIAMVVMLVAALGVFLPMTVLKITGASVLILFGLYKLFAPMSHPRWVGMRVNGRDLATWSFLMATAHGAGLMLVPVLMRMPAGQMAHADHADHAAMAMAMPMLPAAPMLTVVVHSAAMLVVMAVIAVIVFDRIGLRILRSGWFNLDRVWAGMLIAAGALTIAL